MPSHFDRFRLLNGSSKSVRDLHYEGHREPEGVQPAEIPPVVVPTPPAGLPTGGFVDDQPRPGGLPVDHVGNITVTLLNVQGGAPGSDLHYWQLSTIGADPMTEAGAIREVEVMLEDAPANRVVATAQIWYWDGTVEIRISPQFG